jgi:hypothetical protein
VQLAWLVPFIVDPTRETWEASVVRPMRSAHSCVSSYWFANEAIQHTANVYDESLAAEPQADKTAQRIPRKIGPFNIDQFEYPPTFLLVPRLLSWVAPDFWTFRHVWFVLNILVVFGAALAIALRLDAATGTKSVLLTPFVVAGPAIIATFQMGNVQLAVVALSMLAMLLFERRSYAAGGLVLAYVTAAKLYPGVFVLYLILRREWRAVAWTAAFGAALVGLSLAVFGWPPFAAFLEHMPKLMSGEAFPAFRNPLAISVNQSVPGIAMKLRLFGVPGMDFGTMRVVGWVYSLVVIAGVVWLALRVHPNRREPVVWLAILVLATMRSPFLPTYAPFPSMWLATLLAALAWRRGVREAVPAIACWLVLSIGFGPGGLPLHWNTLWSTVLTVTAFVVVTLAFREVRRAAP